VRVTPPLREAAVEPALRRYQAISEHAELELELAGRGEIEALAALAGRWQDLIAGLPPQAPVGAGQLLERAQLIHERSRIELLRMRDALLADLAATRRSRRAADGYAGQLRRRPRLDRSA
jgi:uncharacterized protein YjiS (DUF1127 family)